ncbi:MAG: hypothetical protein WBF88_17640 [Pusillimonas sp.]
MTTDAALTDEQIEDIIEDIAWPNEEVMQFGKTVALTVEQAVLQSPEIQALRKDAERWQKIAGHVYEIKRTHENSPENRVRRIQVDIRKNSPSPSKWLESVVDDLVVDAAMEKQP